MDIDIRGVNKATLLAALYNNTRPQGMGFLHDLGRNMTEAEAAKILRENAEWDGEVSFDYVHGRPVKVGFQGNTLLRADLYDRDAPEGEGICQRIVDSLRK